MTGALHVESAGHGAPVVLLHGWAMHSGLWGPLVAHLAKRSRVHAVDLPGHGRSAAPAAFTLDGVVDALEARFSGETAAPTVLGWSLGGLVAMRWALRAPRRIARLVLVATSPCFVAGPGWPHAMTTATLERFGDELHVGWKVTVQRFLALQLHGGERGRAALAALRAQVFARGAPSPRTLETGLETIRRTDLRAEVAGIAQPALVVAGSRDTLVPSGAGRWLGERLPNARFVEIAGAAHVPFLSHADAFAAAVDPFLHGR